MSLVRSKVYLHHVRKHPCMVCSAPPPCEAHHWATKRGISQKVADYRTVPLCAGCHRAFHSTGALPGHTVANSREMMLEMQVELLAEFYAKVCEG